LKVLSHPVPEASVPDNPHRTFSDLPNFVVFDLYMPDYLQVLQFCYHPVPEASVPGLPVPVFVRSYAVPAHPPVFVLLYAVPAHLQVFMLNEYRAIPVPVVPVLLYPAFQPVFDPEHLDELHHRKVSVP
jgi:hypothetical protein